MREVLFRGKSVDNDEWVEGCLLDAKEDTYIIPHGYEYLYDELEKLAFNVTRHIVIPETVGQFTGLTDKNGRKIFEGDVVELYDIMFIVAWKECEWHFKYIGSHDRDCKVIGNIHDNPELLKGE